MLRIHISCWQEILRTLSKAGMQLPVDLEKELTAMVEANQKKGPDSGEILR
jgi:hypothetical protein